MNRRKYNPDAKRRSRCPHPWCTDCATRRGSKRGVRRERHNAKAALRAERRTDAS